MARGSRGTGRRAAQALLGAAAMAAALLLGVLVGTGPTSLDRAVSDTLLRWCAGPVCRTVSESLAVESGWPFGVPVTVCVPFALVGGVLLMDRGRLAGAGGGSAGVGVGAGPSAMTLRWLLVAALAVPVQEVLSRLYDRTGPFPEQVGGSGLAYPSGAALVVAVSWLGGGMVLAELRPGWLRAWWAVTAAVLVVHALVRVAADKHWVTDIAGSYLLAAGALVLAAATGRAAARAGPS